MRARLRFLWGAVLICGVLGHVAAFATPGPPCRQKALDLLESASPDGFAIYRQAGRPEIFETWIDCTDAQFDLSTAVHETTHFITAETDAFPLIGGGAVARPHEASEFFPPARIANRFARDDLATIYLRPGKASSSTDFLYLLDELNAYSHDLATAVDLKALSIRNEAVDHRDGLAAMMAFVAIYVETARAREPDTWDGLRTPQVAGAISALWGSAERVMAASCGIPNFGSRDKDYIRAICTPSARSALEDLLGRAPACPTACLVPDVIERSVEVHGPDQTDGDVAMASSGASPEERPGARPAAERPRRPFNTEIGRSHHGGRARAE